MGTIDREMELRAAERYAKATKQQENTTPESDAIMLDRRRDFLAPADRGFLESIIEESDLMPLRYFALGQQAAAAVGRIFCKAPDGTGSGFATGFLVAPGILLTNWHVLRTVEWAKGATLTMDSEDDIDGLPKPPRVFLLEPERLYLADSTLDFAFVAVASRSLDGTPLSHYGYLRLFAGTGKIVRCEYATIIQHPNGRQKHIASRNNKITVYPYDDDLTAEEKTANNFLYYSTDTLKGSSGSPVFSDQWFVVSLHRRGVPETQLQDGKPVIMRSNGQPAAADDPDEVIQYISNEGVRISRVLSRVEALTTEGPRDVQPVARRVLEAITLAAGKVDDGPFARATSRVAILEDDQTVGRVLLESFEISHRRIENFPESTGYNEKFLAGHTIPLPVPSVHLRQELAPRLDKPGEFLLPFRHFTTVMHARRRMPVFAAVNIDGSKKPERAMPEAPKWAFDPRIDDAHQPDDSIFSTMLQRGHMAARDYVYWGGTVEEMTQADLHSFTLTNVCPQIQAFNATVEWFKVERQIAVAAEQEKRRVTEFVGPILRSTDPSYDDLRGGRSKATLGTGIRIPLRFWKIVCWVENGSLKHEALILDQRDELEAAGPLEMSFIVPAGVKNSTIAEIESLTDLNFVGIS
jgi:endonuclease G, mitochondrial